MSAMIEGEKEKKIVTDWVSEAKRTLVELGVHIKNMITEAQRLALASIKARDAILNSRETATVMLRAVEQAEKVIEQGKSNEYAIKEFLADMKMYAEKANLDAEIAQTCLDEVVQAASDIDEHIDKTRRTMLNEAKLMQDLKGKANGSA